MPDILERRGSYRPAHLAHLEQRIADGQALAGGTTGNPVGGALFVLTETGDPDEFVATDPYVEAGLVTGWRAEPWTVVAGDL